MSQEVAVEIRSSPPEFPHFPPEFPDFPPEYPPFPPEFQPPEFNPVSPPTKLSKCISYAGNTVFYIIIGLFYVVFIPFYLLYHIAAWLIFHKDVTDDDPQGSPPSFYQRVQRLQETAGEVAKLPTVIRGRLAILLVAWLIVNLTVPNLKNKLVLDTKLWKWSLLGVMVSCGYHVINMVTLLLLYLVWPPHERLSKEKNMAYFVKGMRRSVNLVVLSGSLLLTWELYFRRSGGIKKTEETDVLLHVGTWSFVTLVVAAVLWALKSVLLLKWEADAVYRRFSGRIFTAGSQFYFLGHICGWRLGIFQPQTKDDVADNQDTMVEDHAQPSQASEQPSAEGAKVVGGLLKKTDETLMLPTIERSTTGIDQHNQKKEKETRDLETRRKKAKGILCIGKDATLYDIKKMTKYFVHLSRVSSREDDGTSDVLNHCRKINPHDDPDMCITEKDLISTFALETNDAKILYSKLKDEHHSSQISFKYFEKYMVKAHNNCVALGHTLLDAREVVKVLNQVMTGILTIIVFLAWLLLTDIASTKILVLIASPLLAATFVFGDTCKKIFEGIIFSFINHPFDVGDRCIIDGTELEVKRMSVLSTKFVVIGTREEALYPNSTLASMPIINLKGEPDPSDHVELTLDSKYSKSMLDVLRNKITKHFEEDDGNRYEKTPTIVIKEIGDSVKMGIRFEHVMSIHETTHSQCLNRKTKQKSELLLQLKQFIEEIDGGNGNGASTVIQEDS